MHYGKSSLGLKSVLSNFTTNKVDIGWLDIRQR